MKANKTLFTLAVMLLMAVTAFAQDSPSKQMNQIKRNNSYLYAEATMPTAEEALDVARELLMQQVQEYIGEKNKLKLIKDVLVKNVNSKSESISMMRGTMVRMFVYVKKSDIEAVDNATAIDVTTKKTQVVVEQRVPPTPAPEIVEEPEPVFVEEKEPVVEPVVEAEPVVETIVVDPVVTPEEKTDPVIAKNAGGLASETGLSVWQQQAIEDLLKCADMQAVKAKLNRMKAEYKIKKYGPASNCPNASEAYWIFFNADGSIHTVVGKGTAQRVNFRDMTYTSLENYKGMSALWFNFAK